MPLRRQMRVHIVQKVKLAFLKGAENAVVIDDAIIIVNGVAAYSENKQENKAALLKAEEEAHEIAKAKETCTFPCPTISLVL